MQQQMHPLQSADFIRPNKIYVFFPVFVWESRTKDSIYTSWSWNLNCWLSSQQAKVLTCCPRLDLDCSVDIRYQEKQSLKKKSLHSKCKTDAYCHWSLNRTLVSCLLVHRFMWVSDGCRRGHWCTLAATVQSVYPRAALAIHCLLPLNTDSEQ